MGNRSSGRKEIFELLRSANHLIPYTDEYGNQTMLNPVKHFVNQRSYKNVAYNRELVSIAQKYNEYLKHQKEVSKEVPATDGVVAEVIE
jgi:nicotinamide mononucleotide adenylyltransferase